MTSALGFANIVATTAIQSRAEHLAESALRFAAAGRDENATAEKRSQSRLLATLLNTLATAELAASRDLLALPQRFATMVDEEAALERGETMSSHELYAAEECLLRSLVEGLGFTWWPGADEAPEDWDGGPVLCRDPSLYDRAGIWRRMPGSPQRDVIGYRRRLARTSSAILAEDIEGE